MTYDAAARPLFQVLSCVDVPTGPGSPIGPRGRQVGGGRSVAAPSRRHKPIFPRLAGRCPGPGNGRHCCRLEVDRPAPGGHSRRSSPKRRLMSMKNLRSVRWIVLVLGLMLVAAACGGGGGGGGSGKPATKQGGTLNYGADQEPTGFYNNKQNAVWSDGTPVSAVDFIYLWKNLNGTIKDNDVASTTGYDQVQSVTG